MQEKLSALAAHLTEVEQQLADPAVYTDRERLTALRREQKELTPVVECWQAYLRAQDTAREAEEMLSDRSCGLWHRRSWPAPRGIWSACRRS